jgi:ribosomal protein S18 acetylase RimI-like enzyme
MSVPNETRITLRSAVPEDEEFLFKVYAGTRQEEVAAWGWDQNQQEIFLRMQFRAQQFHYDDFDDSVKCIIMRDGEAIGRMIVSRDTSYIHLTDIALLPEYRKQGIGTQLLNDLLTEGKQKKLPVRLEVVKTNPACNLYKRLGFEITSDIGTHFKMECRPA